VLEKEGGDPCHQGKGGINKKGAEDKMRRIEAWEKRPYRITIGRVPKRKEPEGRRKVRGEGGKGKKRLSRGAQHRGTGGLSKVGAVRWIRRKTINSGKRGEAEKGGALLVGATTGGRRGLCCHNLPGGKKTQ